MADLTYEQGKDMLRSLDLPLIQLRSFARRHRTAVEVCASCCRAAKEQKSEQNMSSNVLLHFRLSLRLCVLLLKVVHKILA